MLAVVAAGPWTRPRTQTLSRHARNEMRLYGISAADVRADYDSRATAISIAVADGENAEQSDVVHPRAIVALAGGKPVEVQLLYPDMGVSEPIAAVAERYGLAREALQAAAQSALAAPDRIVSVQVAGRSAA